MKPLLCIYCKSKITKEIFTDNNYKIVKCTSCSLAFLYPFLTKNQLNLLYSRKYFQQDKQGSGYANYLSISGSLKQEARRKLDFMEAYTKRPSLLLEVGAGMGLFAKETSKMGYEVSATDISRYAVDYMQNKLKLKSFVLDLEKPVSIKNKIDVLTAWDVVEHLRNPFKTFKTINGFLKKGGLLFLTTPNIDSIDSKILGKKWYGFKKIPEHILYFSPNFIERIAHDTGFIVVEIKNWGFVRNLNFIAAKLSVYNILVGRLFYEVIKILNIGSINIYFPLIDMMVVLKKVKDVK